MTKKLFTTGEVCDFCGVSDKTVLKWVQDGEIKAIKLPGSGMLRFYAEELTKFMRKHGFVIPDELKEKTA